MGVKLLVDTDFNFLKKLLKKNTKRKIQLPSKLSQEIMCSTVKKIVTA